MTQSPTPVHDVVRKHYAKRIKNSTSCCGTGASCAPTGSLYPADLLAPLPNEVTSTSYGCGDPITVAALQPGQTVLDLGSGAGLDCLLAAQKVGPQGHVIGVDMTPEMIERARENARRVNAANVEFRLGYLEDLPVESNSVDVVISNCVVNLAPDKQRVFAEAFRVLKPGGKLAISDIVTDGPLPEAIKRSLSAWAGCVAGAVEARDYLTMMEATGFTEITITPIYFDEETVDAALREMKITPHSSHPTEIYRTIYSARITARKPQPLPQR